MRLLYLILFLSPFLLQAQQLTVNRIELNGDHVIFHYSLKDTVPDRAYTISIYASRDNYLNPLTYVSGDFGLEVKPGNTRKLMWNAKQELGAAFDDKISVEIRARVYVPFIRFDSFEKIKRGKPKEVTWRGGNRQNILNFELYNKHDERVATIPNIPAGAGHTSLFIPADVKTGKGYKFKIVDSKNKDQVVYSSQFNIKRKVPLLVLALPLIAAGGAVTFLGGEGSGPGDIPNPHDPPGGN